MSTPIALPPPENRTATPIALIALGSCVILLSACDKTAAPLPSPINGWWSPVDTGATAATMTLPHQRDQSINATAAAPDPLMVQVQIDIDAGLVDTDMRATGERPLPGGPPHRPLAMLRPSAAPALPAS